MRHVRRNNLTRQFKGVAVIASVIAFVLMAFQNCAESLSIPEGSYGSSSTNNMSIDDVQIAPGEKAVINMVLPTPLPNQLDYTFTIEARSAQAGVHYTVPAILNGYIGAGEISGQIEISSLASAGDYVNKEFAVTINFSSQLYKSRTVVVRFATPSSAISGIYHLSSKGGALTNGERHSCALKGGALYCWGYNAQGQLGTGNVTNSPTPMAVASMDSGVQAVAAGYRHTCAIKSGALYCWGLGASNQLGNGATASVNFPQAVFNFMTDVQAVSAGFDHTCAIRTGALYCWGGNGQAQVGHNSGTQSVPYLVPGFTSGVTAVLASNQTTCAVKAGGLYCWGLNNNGQLGIGSTTSANARNPTTVAIQPLIGFEDGVTQISGHGNTVCALKAGSAYCFGASNRGQVGNGATTAAVTSPQQVAALMTPVTYVSPGQHHSCAVKNGQVYCWGTSTNGQLGYGNTTTKLTPDVAVPLVLNPGEMVETVAAGGLGADANNFGSTCARTNRGRVFCWGHNATGQVGDGTVANKTSPVQVALFSNP